MMAHFLRRQTIDQLLQLHTLVTEQTQQKNLRLHSERFIAIVLRRQAKFVKRENWISMRRDSKLPALLTCEWILTWKWR